MLEALCGNIATVSRAQTLEAKKSNLWFISTEQH